MIYDEGSEFQIWIVIVGLVLSIVWWFSEKLMNWWGKQKEED